jgi:hypothetical protein
MRDRAIRLSPLGGFQQEFDLLLNGADRLFQQKTDGLRHRHHMSEIGTAQQIRHRYRDCPRR